MDRTALLPSSNEQMYRVYKKRWFMLAVLTLLNFSNGMVCVMNRKPYKSRKSYAISLLLFSLNLFKEQCASQMIFASLSKGEYMLGIFFCHSA